MSNASGRIVWAEHMTTDPKKSKEFYTKLMGWGIQPFGSPTEPYDMLTNGGTPFGGVMKLPAQAQKMGAPSHWLFYVLVDDLDQAHGKAGKLGAQTLVPPTDIPTVGRFTVMKDPQGAVFAMLKPESRERPPEQKPGIGEISWYELATTDYKAAAKFYTELFGWELRDAHDMGPLGIYQIYGRPGVKHDYGGMFNKPPEMPVAAWCLYASVKDIQAATAQATRLGGQVINGPMEVPGGDWIVQFIDPVGAVFALHQGAA